MQVKCVRAFGTAVPGDVVEVPDGAAVDPAYWEIAGDPPPKPAAPAAAPAPAEADTPEGM